MTILLYQTLLISNQDCWMLFENVTRIRLLRHSVEYDRIGAYSSEKHKTPTIRVFHFGYEVADAKSCIVML